MSQGDFIYYFDYTCQFDPNSKVKTEKCQNILDQDRARMLKDTQAAGERVMQYANIPSCDKTQGQDPFYIRLHEHCTFILNCQHENKFSKKKQIDDFHCFDQTVLYQLLVSITSSRYWGDSYPYLLRIKKQLDPDNIFNHCQSLGSEEELCCP